ncbi:hypothetical protein NVV95_00950 [Herbiconiux sp. CPCC 205716]|uniref:Peptidylprolyl isomerase n=1 Tax=Herbiconiux gentiana TaxID=2970912 RepID=A0ABT2GA83_9MICO|nr:hypothetical protein [Herbiconiux gentiana]MCS5713111.1 hypothetical protein [Herbiconiux gentiana]
MRKLPALILSAGLLLSLAACSTGANAADGCSDITAPGQASESVSVTGDVGGTQTVSFPSPLVADSAELSTVVSNDDPDAAVAGFGGIVNTSYSIYDGQTGAAVGSPSTGLIAVSDTLPQGLQDALACASAGERVALVLPNEDAATIVQGAPGSVVMVFDVERTYPHSASGTPQPAQSGFPAVVRDETGRPGITVTSTEAPDAAESALLIKGDGDTVAEGDALLVQVTSVSYAEPRRASVNTWEEGSPQLWLASDDTTKTTGSKQPAGIGQFLIGQPVGSQVLVVLPTDDGSSATAWVVDVLGVVPPAAG